MRGILHSRPGGITLKYKRKYNSEIIINYLAILRPGSVPQSPLEVCLGVSLDEGVVGARSAIKATCVVGGYPREAGLRRRVSVSGGCIPRSISPHSVNWMDGLSLKFENRSVKMQIDCSLNLGTTIGVKVMLSVSLIAILPPGSGWSVGRDKACCYQEKDRHLKLKVLE